MGSITNMFTWCTLNHLAWTETITSVRPYQIQMSKLVVYQAACSGPRHKGIGNTTAAQSYMKVVGVNHVVNNCPTIY